VWRKLRITVLLLILVCVALGTWLDRVYTTAWRTPLGIALYAVPGDDSPVTLASIRALDSSDFAAVGSYFAQQSHDYGVAIPEPVYVWLGDAVAARPPSAAGVASALGAAVYSLRLRWYAWRALRSQSGPTPHIRIFLLYHDPALAPRLPHSLGLARGLVGVVHLFADSAMQGANQVVLAHEILHTLGATDKYDPATDQPTFPDGYAEPDRDPLYPQDRAELMAGRIPLSPSEARMPAALAETVIGPATAHEIGWR
jgi:hypothetical protein